MKVSGVPISETTKTRVRFVLILLMVVLLVHVVASTSISSVPSNDLGLLVRLPITFWIGLALLALFWPLSIDSQKYQVVGLFFTLLFLFFVPLVIEVPVRISESFYPYGESLLINKYGHLVTPSFALDFLGVARSLPLTSYQNWPLFLYLSSAFKLVTGLPDYVILKFFPFLIISLYGLLTFLILKGKIKGHFALLAGALMVSIFFTRQNYFGPQGIAYIFYLLIIWISSLLFFEDTEKKGTLTALLLFSFVVVILTHALTSYMALIVVFAVFLAQRISHKASSSRTFKLFLLSAVILLAYNIFIIPDFFNRTLQELSTLVLGLQEFSLFRETARIAGSGAQQLSYWSSWAIVITVSVIGALQIISFLNRFLKHKRQSKPEFFFFAIFWLVMVFVFALMAVYGSNEAYQRAFMFGLVPLSFLSLTLLSKKPKILFLALGGLLFLSVFAQYGSDTYRLATEPVLAGTSFFVYQSPNNVSCLYSFYPHVRYFDPLKTVEFVSIPGTLPFTEFPNSTVVNRAVTQADYVIRSSIQHNYYVYFLKEDPLDNADFNDLNRVYDNLDFQLFVHQK
jgi:hypothetical protein